MFQRKNQIKYSMVVFMFLWWLVCITNSHGWWWNSRLPAVLPPEKTLSSLACRASLQLCVWAGQSEQDRRMHGLPFQTSRTWTEEMLLGFAKAGFVPSLRAAQSSSTLPALPEYNPRGTISGDCNSKLQITIPALVSLHDMGWNVTLNEFFSAYDLPICLSHCRLSMPLLQW